VNTLVTKGARRGLGTLDVILLVSSVALVAWGGIYLGHYGGRFDGQEFDPIPTKSAASTGPAALPEAPEFKRGRIVYTVNCTACHGARGEGDEGKGFPPLDKSEWVTAAGPNRLIRILAHAVEGPIKVAGKDYNNPGMLAWAGLLSPEDLAAVATYIRQAWSNKAGSVTKEMVTAVLDETKGREAKWTVAELEKVPEGPGGAAVVAELTPDELKSRLKKLPADKLKELLKELGN